MAEPKNLYQWREFFRLLINGVYQYIEEPIGWDKVNIDLKRDKQIYGANYEFIDEKLNLIFEDHHGGGNELRDLYEERGSDAQIPFEFGFYDATGAPVILFRAICNFNDKRDSSDGIEMSLQKVFFESAFRTRYETKVNFEDTKDLDGNTITTLTPFEIKLHSKKIIKKSVAGYVEPDQSSAVHSSFGTNQWMQPGTDNVTVQELNNIYSMPLGITQIDPFSEERFQFDAEEDGLATFLFVQDYQMFIYGGDVALGNWQLVPQIRVYRGAVLLRIIEDPLANLSGSTGSNGLLQYHNFQIGGSQNLLAGDRVYFSIFVYTQNTPAFTSRKFKAMNANGRIEIVQNTVAASSTAYFYKLYDCFNHVMKSITGQANKVQSSFFGGGGCGEKFALTSGFQLRKFTNKPVLMSMKDLIEGTFPIWNVMGQYSKDGSGDDILLIEPMDSFFGEERIMEISGDDIDYNSYEDEHAKDITFNEIETGYNKFAESDANTLDEVNTYAIWLLPIKSYKDKLQRKSTFIASGFLLEEVRREQFKENPSASLSNDDEIFIVSYIEERIHRDVSFQFYASNKILHLSKKVNLQPGDQVNVVKNGGGGANDATTFTVQARSTTHEEAYLLTTFPVSQGGIGTVNIPITTPEAEKNEAFDEVENLYSPETAYNLRISPAEILFNSASLINACLEKKDDDEIIKNTFFKSNGLMSKRFNPAAECNLRDENNDLQENADKALSTFNSRRQLFKAEFVKFKTKLRYDQLVYLKERVTGASGTDEDFGVVAFPDIHGEMWEGYVWELTYQPDEETCEMRIRKKRRI